MTRSATPPYLTPAAGTIAPPDLSTATHTGYLHVGQFFQNTAPTFEHRTSFPTPGLPAPVTTDIGTLAQQVKSAVGATADQAIPTTTSTLGGRLNARLSALTSRWAGRAPRTWLPVVNPPGVAQLPTEILHPIPLPNSADFTNLHVHPPISAR